MSAPQIKGWCPGAYRPMRSGDGLVVRVRPPHGRLTGAQIAGLADLADAHGNGRIDLTTRANLQLRGVSDAGYPALIVALRDLGLIDTSPEAEARASIVLTPFRSERRDGPGGVPLEAMADALAAGLGAPGMPALPSKFGFVLDAAARVRYLSQVSGDIRIETAGDALIVRADGCATGRAVADGAEAVAVALRMARWFAASGGIGADGRGRMRRHLASGVEMPADLVGDARPSESARPVGPGPVDGGFCIGPAFGAFTSRRLRWLAPLVAAGTPVHVTPFRMLFLRLPHLPRDPEGMSDLIGSAGDPLWRVAACVGAPGCAQASVATRDIAHALAARLGPGQELHVSGCAKGCARPAAASITLVGRDGAFDLVRQGCSWDEPHLRGLGPGEVAEHWSDADAL